MREFKFRVWSKSDNKFIFAETESNDGHGITLDGIFSFCSESHFGFNYSPEEFIIQQWTGLIDKNGKDIYEGDIIQMIYSSGKKGNIEEVKWLNGIDFDYAGWGTYTILTSQWGHSEIIGNIFENPELCK